MIKKLIIPPARPACSLPGNDRLLLRALSEDAHHMQGERVLGGTLNASTDVSAPQRTMGCLCVKYSVLDGESPATYGTAAGAERLRGCSLDISVARMTLNSLFSLLLTIQKCIA